MNSRTLRLILWMVSIPGLSYAGENDWIYSNNRNFFHGMIAFGVLSAVLIVWEIMFQISLKNQSGNAQIKLVGDSPVQDAASPSAEHEDPFKAMLQGQLGAKTSSGGGSGDDNSYLPSFLDEKMDTGSGSFAGSALGSGSMESSPQDSDPFKMLLQSSAKKSPELGAPGDYVPPVSSEPPPVDDDPFKSLLRSSVSARDGEDSSSPFDKLRIKASAMDSGDDSGAPGSGNANSIREIMRDRTFEDGEPTIETKVSFHEHLTPSVSSPEQEVKPLRLSLQGKSTAGGGLFGFKNEQEKENEADKVPDGLDYLQMDGSFDETDNESEPAVNYSDVSSDKGPAMMDFLFTQQEESPPAVETKKPDTPPMTHESAGIRLREKQADKGDQEEEKPLKRLTLNIPKRQSDGGDSPPGLLSKKPGKEIPENVESSSEESKPKRLSLSLNRPKGEASKGPRLSLSLKQIPADDNRTGLEGGDDIGSP